MKCYNCNANISENAAFCPKCGKPQTITPQMLNAALRGNQSAITDLYNKTYNSVYNTIRFLVKDDDTVLDLLQDSYIKAFDSLDQLQNANSFEPWVKRIAHNKAIDYLRSAKPVSFSSLESDDSGNPVEFEDDRPDNLPEVVIDRQETTRLINEILDSLPEDQRACISLFYYDQLSVKEIAEELGVSEATVKSRLQYGRKKIETQVRALEKKGTKLYGLAPIPFLMLLFHQEAQAAELPSQAVLQSVLSHSASQTLSSGTAGSAVANGTSSAKTAGAGVKATGSSAKTAGTGAKAVSTGAKAAASSAKAAGTGAKAVSTGAKAAASSAKAAGAVSKSVIGQAAVHTAKAAIAPKIIAIIAAAAVATGGGTAVVHHIQQTKQETAVVSEAEEKETSSSLLADVEETRPTPELPERPEEAAIPEDPAALLPEETPEAELVPGEPAACLTEIVERYEDLLAQDPQEFLSSRPNGILNDLDYDLVANHFQNGTTVYGGYADYNGDGILELVLALGDESDKYAEAIYFTDGKELSYICIVEELGNQANIYALSDGRMMLHADSDATSGIDIIFLLTGSNNDPGLFLEYEYDEQKYGDTDHHCGSASLTDEAFNERFWNGAIEAAHFDGISFFALTSGAAPGTESSSSANTGSTGHSSPAFNWKNSYQLVLEGYQFCMSDGLDSPNPYPYEYDYEAVRHAIKTRDGSTRIVYALHDVNQDGTPELILALEETVSSDAVSYAPFEVYTIDQNAADPDIAAVPLFRNILKDEEFLHIGEDGTLWISFNKDGYGPTTFYGLFPGEADVEETDFFDTRYAEGNGSYYYLHIVNGLTMESIPRDEFLNNWLPADAGLSYQSILKTIK